MTALSYDAGGSGGIASRTANPVSVDGVHLSNYGQSLTAAVKRAGIAALASAGAGFG